MTPTSITAPDTPGGRARIFDIITPDLGLKKDRIADIRHLTKFSPIFLTLAGSLCRFLPMISKCLVGKRCISSITTWTETSIGPQIPRSKSRARMSSRHLRARMLVRKSDTSKRYTNSNHSVPNTDTLILAKTVLTTSCPRVENKL